ncbi:MAG: DUF1365 domain-containing protein [Gammaproteobacteria bacterium]
MNSYLYKGRIQHRRHRPVRNQFDYGLFQLYLDLDEIDELLGSRWLFSTRRFSPARWRRDDHLGDPTRPLKESVAELLAQHGYRLRGPVRLLTHLRYFGYVSNPVSFYYCFAPDGVTVERVIAEVTNTPWGERHCYVLGDGDAGPGGQTFAFDKAFHVSPFMTMDMQYEWRFSEPGDTLRVHNNSYKEGHKVFDATLTLNRSPLSNRALLGTWLMQPIMTFKVSALIYFQAARLWLKRVPFVTHPGKQY